MDSPMYGGSAGFIPPIDKGLFDFAGFGVGHPIVGMCQIVAIVEGRGRQSAAGAPQKPAATAGGRGFRLGPKPEIISGRRRCAESSLSIGLGRLRSNANLDVIRFRAT